MSFISSENSSNLLRRDWNCFLPSVDSSAPVVYNKFFFLQIDQTNGEASLFGDDGVFTITGAFPDTFPFLVSTNNVVRAQSVATDFDLTSFALSVAERFMNVGTGLDSDPSALKGPDPLYLTPSQFDSGLSTPFTLNALAPACDGDSLWILSKSIEEVEFIFQMEIIIHTGPTLAVGDNWRFFTGGDGFADSFVQLQLTSTNR